MTDSEILAGLLVVAGRTERAHESITLDGKFTAVSDRHRRFAFQVPYHPPAGQTGERGEAGSAGPKGEPGAPALQIRQVRHGCTSGSDCAVACADGEIAPNAVCATGPATLRDEGEISCGSANAAPMIAFCSH